MRLYALRILAAIAVGGWMLTGADAGAAAGAARPERPPDGRRPWGRRPRPTEQEPQTPRPETPTPSPPLIDPSLLDDQPKPPEEPQRKTCLSIKDQAFLINDKPTYPGRLYRGPRTETVKAEERKEYKLEGLLFSARLVNGIFDDLNPATRSRWAYTDGPWDPERNTRDFIKAMPVWRYHGLSAFSLNLQGGSPEGSSSTLPWQNSAYTRDGRLRADYMKRLEAVLDEADQQGLVVILGLFSPGQDQQVWDERSVLQAVDNAVDWLLKHQYTHVLVEVADACDNRQYDHKILTEDRVHELVERVAKRSEGKVDSPAGRLLVGASMDGGSLPPTELLREADVALLQGIGVEEPDRLRRLIQHTRGRMGSRLKPILVTADEHADFSQPDSNLLAAVTEYAGWGFADWRREGESYRQGFQSLPVDWRLNSLRKYAFFRFLATLTRRPPPSMNEHVREELRNRQRAERAARSGE